MAKLVVNGDVNRAFDQVQYENAVRERQQRQRRQAAEVELLEDTTYREYATRRRAQARLLVEPKLPEDEMTYRDYRIAPTVDRRGAPDDEPVLFLDDPGTLGLEIDPVVAPLPPGTAED